VIFNKAKFTDNELAVIEIILDIENEEQRDVKIRKWVHEAWVDREREEEFGTL
jgi:hypothetical protein